MSPPSQSISQKGVAESVQNPAIDSSTPEDSPTTENGDPIPQNLRPCDGIAHALCATVVSMFKPLAAADPKAEAKWDRVNDQMWQLEMSVEFRGANGVPEVQGVARQRCVVVFSYSPAVSRWVVEKLPQYGCEGDLYSNLLKASHIYRNSHLPGDAAKLEEVERVIRSFGEIAERMSNGWDDAGQFERAVER